MQLVGVCVLNLIVNIPILGIVILEARVVEIQPMKTGCSKGGRMRTERSIDEEFADARVEFGTGSIYADLQLKNHEEMETKSNLVIEISKIIKQKKLTQVQAAVIFGISQPKLSELLSGHFRGYSVERLIHFLNELGQDVDIVVRSKPRNRPARVSVYHTGAKKRLKTRLTTTHP